MHGQQNLLVSPIYKRILSRFPQQFAFVFGYGSGVKQQLNNNKSDNMIDLVFCVDNSKKWHSDNLKLNRSDYSFLKIFGPNLITNYQENFGAKIYYNTLIQIDNDLLIKYGVISKKDLISDLLDWNDLYVSGRLHKPIEIIKRATNNELDTALQVNLQSAVHTTLLLLPDQFTEYDFYYTISSLSYLGDFRMRFGENKNKIDNIVKAQLIGFRQLYLPIVKSLKDYVHFPINQVMDSTVYNNNHTIDSHNDRAHYFINCSQDCHPLTKQHHLNQLPKCLQRRLVRFWNGPNAQLKQDTEDVLRAIAYDPDCEQIIDVCLRQIVRQSSLTQSVKGVLTAGFKKSLIYSFKKIKKMFV